MIKSPRLQSLLLSQNAEGEVGGLDWTGKTHEDSKKTAEGVCEAGFISFLVNRAEDKVSEEDKVLEGTMKSGPAGSWV